MESAGIGFNNKFLKYKEIMDRIDELEAQGRLLTKDTDFLLSSPQQCSAYLFDVLKLKVPSTVISKTKAGSSHRSASEEVLTAIKTEMTARTGSSPQILDTILEFRVLNKLLTSFVQPWPRLSRRGNSRERARSKKGLARLYPQWMQTTVMTGRLSCRKPNLQQVPNSGGKWSSIPFSYGLFVSWFIHL